MAAQDRKRRRSINYPAGTFAHFLDALLSYNFCYFQQDSFGSFTLYKNDLAKKLGITARQLSRFLSGDALPESRLLKKFSDPEIFGDAFPHIMTEGWIPRLRWKCIEREFELLPASSVISIFPGQFTDVDLDAVDPAVTMNIASNMASRGFKYVYFFAPLTKLLRNDELEPTRFIERFRLKILSAWLASSPSIKRNAATEKHITESLFAFQTKASADAAHFWSLTPRFLVSVNLCAAMQEAYFGHQFSVVFDRSSVPYPEVRASTEERVPDPVTTAGWSYWQRAEDNNFRNRFAQMCSAKLFVNAEDKRDMNPPQYGV